MMKREACLRLLSPHVGDDIVVAVYSTAFDWIAVRPHPLNYLCVGAMGLGASHALGLALGRPDKRIFLFDGDGSLLMSLGSLVTVAAAAPANLYHFLFENGTYEANGAHPIPGRAQVDFVALAAAAGYPRYHSFAELAEVESDIAGVLRGAGPVFVDLKVEPGARPKYDYQLMHSAAPRAAFKAVLRASRD
jgi:sulfopyruvate decarboxylase subunit beta